MSESKIYNPLGGNFKGLFDLVPLDHPSESRWDYVFNESSSSITIWPQLRAAGGPNNPKPWREGRIDAPIVGFPSDKNQNNVHHLLRDDGSHFSNTEASRARLATFMLDNSNCCGFLTTRKGKLVDAKGHHKTGYFKDCGDGTYLYGERRGRTIVKGGKGSYNDNNLYLWIRDPVNPDRGRFETVRNPNCRGDDPDPNGGGRGNDPDPTPPDAPQPNPAKGSYTDRVQQNNLHSDHNQANPTDPIVNHYESSGNIGGVGISSGLIEGLFDDIAESQQKVYHFFLPDLGVDFPFSNDELQQVLRELASGIFENDAFPYFSLHFNSECNLYPVLHPVYQNTLVGEVIGMLDFLMKGFLNGGYYTKEAIDRSLADPSLNLTEQFVDLNSYCLEHRDLLPEDFEYQPLTAIIYQLQEAAEKEGIQN